MTQDAIKYKLGLDLGSTSLGWAVVKLDADDNPSELMDMGVRIFPDGRDAQSHTPINVVRRQSRQMRRRTDRVLIRKRRTLALIHKYGLDFNINQDRHLEDPYALRVRALNEKLTPSELGRVFFHFAQRRGFKSNRKETRGTSGGKLKTATQNLENAVGNGTLAQFQMSMHRFRFSDQFDGAVIKDGALYPTRNMYTDEFDKICNAQQLPNNMCQEFRDTIFFQRPLKPVDVGTCIFESGQPRAYKFEPEFQRWRALQRINQLKILGQGIEEELTKEQRQKLYDTVLNTFEGVKRTKSGAVKISFSEIKKQLGLTPRKTKFNLESKQSKDKDEDGVQINVDTTGFAFFEIGESNLWHALSDEQRSDILHKINDQRLEDEEVIQYLISKYDLDRERAEKIIKIPLEESVASVSLKAIRKMMEFLERGDLYHTAVENAGYNFAKNVELFDKLPYYGSLNALRSSLTEDKNGRYRIMNATVHIALNQLRAVVNELLDRYGKPYEINIEMSRDAQANSEERAEIENQQRQNKKENERIAARLREMDQAVNKENIQRFKLWEKLASKDIDRRCVYTGEMISKERLFSPDFEVDHVLPYSLTFDNSMANKVLCARRANRFKKNRCPYDAFTASDSPWNYNGIWQRAEHLPDSTKWRFEQGALKKFLQDHSCIARAMNDTKYVTRVAVSYLQHLYGNTESYKVRGTRGTTTQTLRDGWRLNWWKNKADKEKYRANHIHHAIDAFVIACTNDELLEKLQKNAHKAELQDVCDDEKLRLWFVDIEKPFMGFDYYSFKEKCENTIISYKTSKKDPKPVDTTIGCLHEDTAYNLERFESDKTVNAVMSRRIALPRTDKERGNFAKDYKNINDTTRQMFLHDTGIEKSDPKIADKFLTWATERGIKKVRMIKSGIDISTYVPVFRTKQERDEYWNAYTQWYVQDGISVGITDKKRKQEQLAKERELLTKLKQYARQAYKWYVGGNNFCAEVFEIRSDDIRYPKDAGTWKLAIVSNYMAELNPGEPLWRKKYPTARRVMSLRINDMVMAEFSKDDPDLPNGLKDAVAHQCAFEKKDTIEMVFRVKKLSSSGKIYLRPHFIAKEDADTRSWGASASSLQKHNAHKIVVSPTGKILK